MVWSLDAVLHSQQQLTVTNITTSQMLWSPVRKNVLYVVIAVTLRCSALSLELRCQGPKVAHKFITVTLAHLRQACSCIDIDLLL